MADVGYLTIGKVVKKLQPQYPDLSVSKVRYLEEEGLLTPSARTPGGYRLYTSKDIKRLETILYLQKTKFLPLSVIKDELDGASERPSGVPAIALGAPHLAVDITISSKLHPIENTPELIGVSIGFVRQLKEIGMIEFITSPQGRVLVDGKDFPLIKACDALRRYGVEPKNLRQYVTAANRESAMFEQALSVYTNRGFELDEKQTEEFDESFDQILALVNAIRVSLIKKQVKEDFNIK